MVGEKVVLRTRMSAGDAHYAGELVEGAHIVTAWGDVGTELAIRLFGDESPCSWAIPRFVTPIPFTPATSWSIPAGSRRLATPL